MATTTVSDMSIAEGLEFILSHTVTPSCNHYCKTDQYGTDERCNCTAELFFNDLWPKRISTYRTKGAMIGVRSPKEALAEFYRSKLLDCRICAYPEFIDEDHNSFWKGAREAMTYGGRGVMVSLLLIDLDKGAFRDKSTLLGINANELLKKALLKTLNSINKAFCGEYQPSIIWTGNGYHIYQPVYLSGPSWCLAHTDIFANLTRDPDTEFLRWVERYLSDGKADPEHTKTVSLKNTLLRVPGSINSKNNTQVRIIRRWAGQRPAINSLLREFRRYLIGKKAKPDNRTNGPIVYSTDWSKKK